MAACRRQALKSVQALSQLRRLLLLPLPLLVLAAAPGGSLCSSAPPAPGPLSQHVPNPRHKQAACKEVSFN